MSRSYTSSPPPPSVGRVAGSLYFTFFNLLILKTEELKQKTKKYKSTNKLREIPIQMDRDVGYVQGLFLCSNSIIVIIISTTIIKTKVPENFYLKIEILSVWAVTGTIK
jgi:hypothetical protein